MNNNESQSTLLFAFVFILVCHTYDVLGLLLSLHMLKGSHSLQCSRDHMVLRMVSRVLHAKPVLNPLSHLSGFLLLVLF